MKVIISNGIKEITLSLDKDAGEKFIEAIENCIKRPKEYPMINYQDKKDKVIFTAKCLKNSLITIPIEDLD